MRRHVVVLVFLALLAGSAHASTARADGDPGSDVLVYQPLFLGADAGISVKQQVQLGGLLEAASRAGFPVRVAIISGKFDLGAVTGLWREPRAYARFLGIELSLAYKGRLLVVMPNGFGFNWPGHSTALAYRVLSGIPITPGGVGLATAVQTAVTSLAAAEHVKIASHQQAASGTATAGSRSLPTTPARNNSILVIVAVLSALAASVLIVRLVLQPGGRARNTVAGALSRMRPRASRRSLRWGVSLTALVALVVGVPIIALSVLGAPSTAHSDALASNPNLDPGTRLSGPAPDFTLSDEFGRPVSLHSFRGKVVILAFNDSECTTICPLTTSAMLEAKAMLGPAGGRIQLLGIDANPKATALADVLSYSQLHGMLHQWHFLTGSLPALRQVWKHYSIGVGITQRQIDHTPALFVIDAQGRLAKLYVTQQSYAAVAQYGQVLAQEVSSLLPGHPRVRSQIPYTHVSGITPSSGVALPRAGGGTVRLGPGRSPHLFLFFATWDQEVTSLAGQLNALNAYQASAATGTLPALTAVDEGSVEPTPATLPRFLQGLSHPLSYPVAIDQSGRLADGYGVQGEPWFVLTSAEGRILWYWQVATSGWPGRAALARHIRAALARAPKAPASAAAAARQLAGSPAPLAALHQQASQLLGSQQALATRVRVLHGYPIVINAWASWCTPCRSEFSLFASASAHYGHEVAFLGADSSDSPADAQAFLAQHPVSYPSYQTSTTDLRSLAVIEGLPTTIFIDRAGKVVYVHTGQYDSQGTLDGDISSYAGG